MPLKYSVNENQTMANEIQQFEEKLREDLHQYLLAMKEADERQPDCPDVEGKWEEIAQSYLPDGIREFKDYPTSSLGWMMYIGMAVTAYWDTEWNVYADMTDIYTFIRDKRGYDALDEYVREEVLQLKGAEYDALERLVGECASRICNALRRQNFEPGTKTAFDAYVACLHQMYLAGIAIQLKRMGYRMVEVRG